MASSTPINVNSKQTPAQWLAWLPIIAGLAVLYVPSFTDLMRGIWSTDEQAHPGSKKSLGN